jgi:hypothetical protein
MIMPSWVAPALAADYWNVSEDEIWQRIHSGELPARREGGFYFVDVAPDEVAAAVVHEPHVDPSDREEPTLRLPWIDARRQAATKRRPPAAKAA